MKTNIKNNSTISLDLAQSIELIYFVNFIRREFIKKFGVSIDNFDEKKMIKTDLEKIKNIKSYLNGEKLKVADNDLLDVLGLFGKYIDEYFNELNNLMFGQLYSIYKDMTVKDDSKVIGYLLKELESENKLIIPPDVKLGNYNLVSEFLTELKKNWKELKNKKNKTHVS